MQCLKIKLKNFTQFETFEYPLATMQRLLVRQYFYYDVQVIFNEHPFAEA